MTIKLTEQQESAIKKTSNWLKNDSKSHQLWKVGGTSGSGKSTIVPYIIDDCKIKHSDVAFMTISGKASLRLRRLGIPSKTIHSTIYERIEVKDKKTGKTVEEWMLKEFVDCKIFVIDEISMVSDDIMSDIKSFGKPIIGIGDHAQLQPPNGKNTFFDTWDVRLTEIHRQALDNDIIRFSNMILQNNFKFIPSAINNDLMMFGNDVMIYRGNKVIPIDTLASTEQILVGTHKMRQHINGTLRKFKGFDSDYFSAGEKLICKINNKNVNMKFADMNIQMLNGIIGFTSNDFDSTKVKNTIVYDNKEMKDISYTSIDFTPDFCIGTENKFENVNLCLDTLRNDSNVISRTRTEQNIIFFNYGYAITVHASQGSEFENVVAYNDFTWDLDMNKRYLYTAITRAKKKLIIKL